MRKLKIGRGDFEFGGELQSTSEKAYATST